MDKGIHMNKLLLAVLVATLTAASAQAAISVRDDDGQLVTLAKPAQRVISMARKRPRRFRASAATVKWIWSASSRSSPT
jgi:ABC-type Fe3+-hydroxamate transport system substrate-binding protein